jgi:hypothetical protein
MEEILKMDGYIFSQCNFIIVGQRRKVPFLKLKKRTKKPLEVSH